MRKFSFAILLLLCTCNLAAQEILTQPQAKLLTKFRFKVYSGGVMILEARLGNIPDTLNFILDTGSGGISLDSSTCAELKISTTPSDTTITGIAGIHKVPFVFDQTLHLPGLDVNHLNFHVNDYDILSSVYGEKIDGVIGYSFLSRYIVKLDFDSTDIEVYSKGDMRYPNGSHTLRPIFTTLPIQWLHLKDARKKEFNFYFDTGAGLCFLMSEQFAKDSSILLTRRKPVITQAEGIGGRLQMRLTVIKQLKVGPYTFFNVPTYLYSDSFNVTSYPFVGGLIGNDLMRRFNMVLNYDRHEINIYPNSHYKEPFDYAYTGMGIYFENGKVMVEDIIKDSPADKAGIKVSDVIIAVSNNFSNNIMQYKNLLQVPNEKIKVVISRDHKPIIINLKTGTIN
ncbi:MAG: aspartyl protease family protein [Ferruginibacter sp.]